MLFPSWSSLIPAVRLSIPPCICIHNAQAKLFLLHLWHFILNCSLLCIYISSVLPWACCSWSWSVWSIEYGRSDGIPLLKLDYKRHWWLSPVSLLGPSLWDRLAIILCVALWRDSHGRQPRPLANSHENEPSWK